MANQGDWVVLKFGGTSVATKERWQTIDTVLRMRLAEGKRPLLVCSAMAGMSNLLEKLLSTAEKGAHQPHLDEVKAQHARLCQELGLTDGLAIIAPELEKLTRLALGISLIGHGSPKLSADVMALGELMLTRLGNAWLNTQKDLNSQWVDARELLVADGRRGEHAVHSYLSAVCNADYDERCAAVLTKASTHATQVLITQGFIASNDSGETVLLGRGGSDTSAAYLGAKIAAQHVEIWTDVPGLFTSNPREVPSARLIKQLGYEEAQELASSGAKVLHPRCIDPLRRKNIPIHIGWTERPTFCGTVIAQHADTSAPKVKAVVSKHGIQMIAMESMGMWQEVGFLADIFACFKKHGLSIDLIATSQSNVTVTLDSVSNLIDSKALARLMQDLALFCYPRLLGPCAAVSLVGRNIRAMLPKMGAPFEVFEEKQIYLISQAASDLNFSFTIDEAEAAKIVQRLHSHFFAESGDEDTFGPSWSELFSDGPPSASDHASGPWWLTERLQLIALAKATSPLYAYYRPSLKAAVARLKSLKAITGIHYAVKANSHPEILRLFYREGLQFDCVSWQEVTHVMQEVEGIDPSAILFTPNFAPLSEYQQALALGCRVTLDNIFPLAEHPEVFAGHAIFVRLDPDKGQGHHRHVRTAGPQAKFGIGLDELPRLKALIAKHRVQVVGLHAHVGSGIRTPETWAETALFLAQLTSEHFPEATVIDVGGGFGVPEKAGQRQLDLLAMAGYLEEFQKAYPQLELWIEPGRYLVAEAGVLLAKVTQLKQKGNKTFVGVDAGMNALIRPALYGAYHHIVNLERWGAELTLTADIVGPICETGDVLGHARTVPLSQEGDVFLIANAGAYGREMASHYNRRTPPGEEFID